jgi:predicted DNA-binding transcriptional regulator AlpA
MFKTIMEVVMVHDRLPLLLRVCDVCLQLKVSRATLYRKVGSGAMPKPIYLDARVPRWDASELADWLALKAQA